MAILFKYLSSKRDFFSDGFIRLTQLSALNDPFEAQFCYKGLDRLVQHFDDPMTYNIHEPCTYQEYLNVNKSKIGIISFSESKENLLMWAHYANEHKGFVAGVYFDEYYQYDQTIFENLFTSKVIQSTNLCGGSFFDGRFHKVNYRKSYRYSNDMFDHDYGNISMQGGDRMLYEIFLGKSDEWIYEKEHRIILRLEQADRVLIKDITLLNNLKAFDDQSFISFDSNTEYYAIDLYKIEDDNSRVFLASELAKFSYDPTVIFQMKIKRGSIFQCILGLNSSYRLNDILDDIGYSIEVYEAVFSPNSYTLNFKEIFTRF